MIASSICVIDQKKVTSAYGYARVVNTLQVYVFLDILSRDKLLETTRNLEKKLSNQNMVNSICFPVGLVVFVVYVLWISKQIAESIEIDLLTMIFFDLHQPKQEGIGHIELLVILDRSQRQFLHEFKVTVERAAALASRWCGFHVSLSR